MNKTLLIIIMVASFQNYYGQNSIINNEKNKPEVAAKFPGGINMFYKYIRDNFKSPKNIDFKGGKIWVNFTIDTLGKIKNIKTRDVGFGTREEVLRVFELSPKWQPALNKGKAVNCNYSIPITVEPGIFSIEDVDEKPEYKNGIQEFYRYISNNVKIKEEDLVSGNIYLLLIIEKDGTITVDKIKSELPETITTKILGIVKKSPNWIPAEIKNQKVRCHFSIPIKLQN